MPDIYDILSDVQGRGRAYEAKMMHPIPDTDVVDRIKFILQRCAGKRVLDCGCAQNHTHEAIKKVAKEVFGIDKNPIEGDNFFQADLDKIVEGVELPLWHVDIVVCGELIEHLTNPGAFLRELHKYNAPVLLTVPNAHGKNGYLHARSGTENVNIDHVAYYSWRTLVTLADKCGYQVDEYHWYNGEPRTAEGLTMIISRKKHGTVEKESTQ